MLCSCISMCAFSGLSVNSQKDGEPPAFTLSLTTTGPADTTAARLPDLSVWLADLLVRCWLLQFYHENKDQLVIKT